MTVGLYTGTYIVLRLLPLDDDRLVLRVHPLLLGGLQIAGLLRAHRNACTVRITLASSAKTHRPGAASIRAFRSSCRGPAGNGTSDCTLGSHVLSLERIVERLSLERRAGPHEARGLDHFERIRRCHQHLRQELVRIERDGREQAVELVLRHRVGRRVTLPDRDDRHAEQKTGENGDERAEELRHGNLGPEGERAYNLRVDYAEPASRAAAPPYA
jgi:hypothetical protein